MSDETDARGAMERFYAAEVRYSASGDAADRAALLDTLHPDIVLHQPASLPYGGEWRGRAAFGEWLDAFVATWCDIVPTDAQLHSCGDRLFATVAMQARSRATGATIRMPMCQVITVREGRPALWHNYAWDTAAMVRALDPAASPMRPGSPA